MPEVLEEPVHEGGDRKKSLEPGHARQEADHGSQGIEGLRSEAIPDDGVEDGPDLIHEGVESAGVPCVELGHLGLHPLGIPT